ncbi:glycosyltransferase family 2 protein [Prosthecobacter sp.]|uniref:glycosyltransferase family 2 protein n=1 Tax=Prosthecobacter sp. TaxID=1965333 RepID=UPI003783EFF2
MSAVLTACGRPEITLKTIGRLLGCRPPPAEVRVHVDNGGTALAEEIRARFPTVHVVVSATRIGPGGGRNRLLQEAQQELVASFDDDSYPADGDFFQRVLAAAAAHPQAAVMAAVILDGTGAPTAAPKQATRVASFVGCGCVYRRAAFLATSGYVPLPLAYGMEEVDLALRLHAQGGCIVFDPGLRVVHELDLRHRLSPQVAAAMMANSLLLVYLRYPLVLWPLGALQCLRKAMELLRQGGWRGITEGLRSLPGLVSAHRASRQVLPWRAIVSYILLRRRLPA